jgi:hypothetical protein
LAELVPELQEEIDKHLIEWRKDGSKLVSAQIRFEYYFFLFVD